MINIPGYTLTEKVHESGNVIVYRGLSDSDSDKNTYLFKVLKRGILRPADIAKLKLEYEKTQSIESGNVVKVYGIRDSHDGIVLILEDVKGVPLNVFQNKRPIDLETSLKIAIQLANALDDIHKHDLIHGGVSPQHIFINEESGVIKLDEFGLLSHLTRDNESFYDKVVLETRLPYISPEQTGRMNRTVDYRTDFYSLGTTLYEMLTTRVPFQSSDPMELIHCHIAKKAIYPTEINSKIPRSVCDIIMKLLSKDAEERYQSGYGLKADLETCLDQLRVKGKIEAFVLVTHDVSDRFTIPQKLYGREEEIKALMIAFDRVSGGEREIMLVSGYPGVGKTTLIREIHKPIARQRGYFISGKYDQLRRDVPYSAIIQGFKGLIRQILTESEERIQLWRENLLKAVGVSGQIIADVIPDVELIIGKQPSVPHVGPTELQNRFNRIFQRFVSVFTKKEHPIVLFLDDLQWVDLASLNLLKTLITDAETRYLFVIGAYRDTEVSASHPFVLMIEDVIKTEVIVHNIALSPLKKTHVNQLVEDTLHCTEEKAEPLARLVYEKTEGNPFFVNQFLVALYDNNALIFDIASGWKWDIEHIEKMPASDNVVDLMVSKITRLSPNTQEVLKLASCMGNRFILETLSLVHGGSIGQTYSALYEAIHECLILRSGDRYQFLHDRIQEAAYSLIPDEEKGRIHYTIGNLLLKQTKDEELEEKIFFIVDQINAGINLIDSQAERYRLAELNLIAGKKAKASTAYASAASYLKTGMNLLSEDSWRLHYELTYSLYMECSECEYLTGNFEEAEKIFDVILKNAQTDRDKAKVYRIKVALYQSKGKFKEAIEYGIKGLKLLGLKVPRAPGKLAVLLEIMLAKWYIGRRKPEDLLNLPEMADPNKEEIMGILLAMGPSAYFVSQDLMSLIMLKMLIMSLRYGNTPVSSPAYGLYGMILCGALGNYKTGYEFGKLSLHLSERYHNLSAHSTTKFLFGGFINHWRNHIKTCTSHLIDGYIAGLESGNFVYTGYCAGLHTSAMTFKGDCLDDVVTQCKEYIDVLKKIKHRDMYLAITGVKQAALSLKGLTRDPSTYNDDSFDEDRYREELQELQKLGSPFPTCLYYVFKLPVLYICENYAAAFEIATELHKNRQFLFAIFHKVIHNFYYSLTLTSLYPTSTSEEKKQYWKILKKNQRQMKKWADNCPENFSHKYFLVAAEMARISGKDHEAEGLYDQAITSARENEFIQEEAIANELAAKYYLSRDREIIARAYMLKARSGYVKWGAIAKVNALDKKYPQLLGGIPEETIIPAEVQPLSKASPVPTPFIDLSVLDLATVLKSSQTISKEISLNKLLDKLMHIMIENAGAQKGFLVLEKDSKLFIEAEGRVDRDEVTVLQSIPLDSCHDLSPGIIQYVKRTKEHVVLNDATNEGIFTTDPYIVKNHPKSILCTPIIKQNILIGILYLENNLITNAFTPARLEVLNLLSSQASISLENAKLYDELELRVKKRTAELTEANVQLAHRAFHDPLTHLPNRALLMDRIRAAFERKNRYKDYLFAVLFLDADRFKVINDSLGHIAGDQLLIMLAQRLKKTIRTVDTVARLGGDEFAILLEDVKDVKDVHFVADRIHTEIKAPFNLHEQEIFTTVSIGIATSDMYYTQPEELLRDADIAMYNAKARGRACHVVFDSSMHTQALTALKLETDLRRAIERNEFRVYYQPIVSIENNIISGFEALVRWHHPNRGLVPPSEFIQVAEESELIMPIGQWVLREACRQMRLWQEQFPIYKDLTINVNLSSREFSQPNFVELIKKILQETGLEGRSLRLEITERMIIENLEFATTTFNRLKDLNVRFVIDDFGTGNSAISYLRYLPIHALKIDRSFINFLEVNEKDTMIVKTIVAMAHTLKLDVIAEGVETKEQLALLKDMKGEYAQGYLFHKPMDSNAAETLLAGKTNLSE